MYSRHGTACLCSFFLMLAACTSTQVLSPTSDAARLESIKSGDQVTITKVDGARIVLTVSASDGERIAGADKTGATHSVKWSEIASVEHKKNAPGKTAAAVGGTLAGVYLLIAVITAVGIGAILSGEGS